jgi:hypothetical protein
VKRLADDTRNVSLLPKETVRVFDENVSTKAVGLRGPNEKAYQYVAIHAFDDGLGRYYHMQDRNKLVKMSEHQTSKSDPIALVEWEEKTPGEHKLVRYTWENLIHNIPGGKEMEHNYINLQEGVR